MSHIDSSIILQQKQSSIRYATLDSLRGIAAFGVLLTHCFQMTLPVGFLNHTPLRLFVNGRSFVIFFFVLSGFVLATAIWNGGSKRGYWHYAVKRMIRLYPPYWVAGLIAALAAWGAGSDHVLGAFASYSAALGTALGTSMNPPSWSLVFELRISLLMPVLCLLIARKPLSALLITVVIFCLAEVLILALGIGRVPYGAETIVTALVISARFLVCFSVGALLAYDAANGNKVWHCIAGRKIAFLLLSFVLMSVLLDQASLIGSLIIISLALNWPIFKKTLDWRVFRWLGRISFSLYLTHFIILERFFALLSGVLNPWLIVLLAISTALLAAEVFFEFIEKPTIEWSRRI